MWSSKRLARYWVMDRLKFTNSFRVTLLFLDKLLIYTERCLSLKLSLSESSDELTSVGDSDCLVRLFSVSSSVRLNASLWNRTIVSILSIIFLKSWKIKKFFLRIMPPISDQTRSFIYLTSWSGIGRIGSARVRTGRGYTPTSRTVLHHFRWWPAGLASRSHLRASSLLFRHTLRPRLAFMSARLTRLRCVRARLCFRRWSWIICIRLQTLNQRFYATVDQYFLLFTNYGCPLLKFDPLTYRNPF